MSLPRKDVRVKLDPEVHEALLVIAEADGLLPGEWVEREIERVIAQRVHKARLIASAVSHTIKSGTRGDDDPVTPVREL